MRGLLLYMIMVPLVLGAIVIGGMLDGWAQLIFGTIFFGLLGLSLLLDLRGSFGGGDARDPWLEDDGAP